MDPLSIPASGQHFFSILPVRQRMPVDQYLHGRFARAVVGVDVEQQLSAFDAARIEMKIDARPLGGAERFVQAALDAALVRNEVGRRQTSATPRLRVDKAIARPGAKIRKC